MKIFQVKNNRLHWDATEKYPTIEDTRGKFAPNIVFVEAPDFAQEGWIYDETKTGDERFIEYPSKEDRYKALTVAKIRAVYSADDEYSIHRKLLAYSDDAESKQKFEEYNTFIERCKEEAYAEIYGNNEEGDE